MEGTERKKQYLRNKVRYLRMLLKRFKVSETKNNINEKDNCQHLRRQKVLIGHDNTAGSLFYEMLVCLDCGKYIDIRGDLIEFQNTISKKIDIEWRWNDQYMSKELLATMKPGLIRICCRIINPK